MMLPITNNTIPKVPVITPVKYNTAIVAATIILTILCGFPNFDFISMFSKKYSSKIIFKKVYVGDIYHR